MAGITIDESLWTNLYSGDEINPIGKTDEASEYADVTADYLKAWKEQAEKLLPSYWRDKIHTAARGHAGGVSYPRNKPLGDDGKLPAHVAELDDDTQRLWRRAFNAALKRTRDRDAALAVADSVCGVSEEGGEDTPLTARERQDLSSLASQFSRAAELIAAAERMNG